MKEKTLRSPVLFVDDHHGQYMGKIAWEILAEEYKEQAKKHLSAEDIAAITNIEDEWHHEAVDKFTRIDFKKSTGQKFNIEFAEGGMWVIPHCFHRTKAAADFFGH